MDNIFKRYIVLWALITSCLLVAQGQVVSDSIQTSEEKQGVINKIVNYFANANKERRDKAFDVSFIGGPHYSNEKKFGIGLLAAGVYSTNRTDTLTPLSNVSVYADVSTSGFYSIGIKGTSRFNQDRFRVDYDAYFESMPSKFWGIGYSNDVNDDNETNYKNLMSEVQVDALFSPWENLYLGPMFEMSYVKGVLKNEERSYLWEGEDMRTFNYGIGVMINYDTRDNLTAPKCGVNVSLKQRYYGKWMGNTYAFSSTEFVAAWYTAMWKDCTMALQYHTNVTYGDTPWGLLASMGGSHNMRGYYEGRYRDKGEMDVTLELRQRVYKRVGVVAWGGVGEVFPKLSAINIHHLLPNYGFGFRWEFKKNVNVRLDMGFGKNQSGFVFNINEAF
ncbi:MAG: BamA/TamA family outer membrane protein [Muribaculaceae bacterium]|nr:BamA/TamA family outer membrane protein [Muribaculaceae bacterium]